MNVQVKKGSAELAIMAILEHRARHGYEIGRLIEERSSGALKFETASLYPTLYRLEGKGLIFGRWVEAPGQRRRRFYRLTAKGRQYLRQQRDGWLAFFTALNSVARFTS